MSRSGPLRGANGPHHALPPSCARTGLAAIAVATAAGAATAATAAAASHAPPSRSRHDPPSQPLQSPLTATCLPLAVLTASPAFPLMELLGPSLAQAAGQWLNAAAGALQRALDQHLADLRQGGCPATSAVLRAHWVAAGLQVLTLGLATRFMMLDRAAVVRGQVWRLVTWGLVHAGPLHFATNYAAIAQLGPQLEKLAGPDRFAAVYCASSVAATAASLALNGGRPSLGSSGAVFGIAAALWRYHAAHWQWLPEEAQSALRVYGDRTLQGTAVYHLLLWSRLDVSAHVFGALGGWTASQLLGPTYRLERASSSWNPWPLKLLRKSNAKGGGDGGGGAGPSGLVGGPALHFRDCPEVEGVGDQELRKAIPFPALGPGYSVAAAAVTDALRG